MRLERDSAADDVGLPRDVAAALSQRAFNIVSPAFIRSMPPCSLLPTVGQCNSSLADPGKAWWLLCHDSPTARKADVRDVVALDSVAVHAPISLAVVVGVVADEPVAEQQDGDK